MEERYGGAQLCTDEIYRYDDARKYQSVIPVSESKRNHVEHRKQDRKQDQNRATFVEYDDFSAEGACKACWRVFWNREYGDDIHNSETQAQDEETQVQEAQKAHSN